ncbi:MAG: 30S ribosomal protein S5 [Dehalococcoidia bacterium]|nr:30S ribosomal protein S5 [Chloroflexota bacterium]MDP6056297.1 30S ribosomal protein S5 [Dehalococcoidia bacterium]MDP7090315.1 30S ribosomal protein S5 [Dehalococcoidia bacterium]MDP7261024.1 30S ribosomal protein S5 [Dehalococcoidia bacterium]MDP7485137.1 30S ribosomal protein S5 [Dehalococcoidia bacterium]
MTTQNDNRGGRNAGGDRRPGSGGRGPGGGRGKGGGRGPGGERRSRRPRREEEDSGLVERVVKIRRVSKVVKGGRNLTFNAMVVVGDGNGNVGAALGKAGAVPDAVRKGTTYAKKAMNKVELNGPTIPHEITSKFSGAKVLLRPAAPGTGVIAGGGVRAVMEAVGVKDVLSKTFGSPNTINIVKATLDALDQLRDPVAAVERRKGVSADGSGASKNETVS